jgi:hypothetical protein
VIVSVNALPVSRQGPQWAGHDAGDAPLAKKMKRRLRRYDETLVIGAQGVKWRQSMAMRMPG